MDKGLKTYRVIPSTSDVYAISLVENPAVESSFIALSKQRPMNFKIQDTERRIVYGVALRADYEIYRCYGNEEFNIVFDKDAIIRLMTKFMKNYSQKNWTKDHFDLAEGITVVESWIVEDVENDKAKALGLENFSEGSWIVGAKIDDDEIWRSIKEGRWTGFSVEAWCDFGEIDEYIENNKLNKENKMNKKVNKAETILSKIRRILAGAMDEEEVQDVVEEVVDQVESQTETTEEAIDQLETVVEEIENAIEEGTDGEETEMEEEVPTEGIAEEVVNTVEDANDSEEGTEEDLQAIVDALNEEIETLKAENEELKKKNQKMSKKPSTKVNIKQTANGKANVKTAFAMLKSQNII